MVRNWRRRQWSLWGRRVIEDRLVGLRPFKLFEVPNTGRTNCSFTDIGCTFVTFRARPSGLYRHQIIPFWL